MAPSTAASAGNHGTAPGRPEQGPSTPTVQNRQTTYASVEEDTPQSWTAVGERGQHRIRCSSDRIEVAADQRREIAVGLRHSIEDLPSSCLRLDVADPDLQVPLAALPAADEGRI